MRRSLRERGVLLCGLFAGLAQAGERGSFPVQVYEAQELGAGNINEAVTELDDGRIAVANVGGVFTFDGARWRQSNHPDLLGGVRRLAPGPDGRIYTAFNGDIGYFTDRGARQMHWNSLKSLVPEADRGFGAMVDVHYDAARSGVWFLTSNRLFFFSLRDESLQVHAIRGMAAFGARVGDDYWIQDSGGGLQRVAAISPLRLEAMPQSDAFDSQDFMRAVVPDGDGWKALVSDGRLLAYRDGRFTPWAEALWPQLDQLRALCLLRLRDGRWVVAGSEGEPMLLDRDGTPIDRLEQRDGVPLRATRGLFEDRAGSLWLAQEQNIVRVDLGHGVTQFDERRGLTAAYGLQRWGDELYVASGYGLYRLASGANPGAGQFERVLPVLRNVRFLAVLDQDGLLVSSQGLHVLERDATGALQQRVLLRPPQVLALVASRFVPGRAWLATPDRVLRIERGADGAITHTELAHIDWPVNSITEADADTLWLADRAGGVWRASAGDAFTPQRIGPAEGVPPGTVRLYPRRGDGVWFATTEGLRAFDEAAARLVTPTDVPPELQQRSTYSLLEDRDGNLWARVEALTDVAWRRPSGFEWDRHSLLSVSTRPTTFAFLREEAIVWVARANGLLRIDLAARQSLPPPLPPRLVRVEDMDARSSVTSDQFSDLPDAVRSLRLSYALPAAARPAESRYRSRMIGLDRDWTEWSATATREFTNLPDGALRFELEARDVFERVTALEPVALRVAAPWWRTSAAIAGYAVLALLALWWASRLGAARRQRAMLARQQELEAVVAQRTGELRERNAQLAEQAERLTEVDRLKTRFFVNVGHEFRTPLTLVLGPIDDLLRDARERFSQRAREQLEMANRNARRVLDLIVELLDVNRYEHGQVRLNRVPTDLLRLAHQALGENAPLLERHGHRASVSAAQDTAFVARVDPPQLRRCLDNLIGNAAKYMARGGRIELRLQRRGDSIELSVADQGRGIAAAALPHVFDRFFQADGDDRASGYGVGLALVREIVEAHEGRVGVSSEPGVGSTFTLVLAALDAAIDAAADAPRDEHDATAAPAAADADPKQDGESARAPRDRPRVLVVDDHDDLRARVRGLIVDDYEVIEAADGPSAWKLARDHLPDLVVCDVMMPGFDGIEFARRLRADGDTAAIALLLLTAKAGGEHAAAGLRSGADDYLSKPFDASELLARIAALLARSQRLRLQLARERLPAPAAPASENAEQRWRRRFDELIAQRLDDAALSVEQLADAMHTDRSQLFRRCKQQLGMSPSEYLRDTRLKRAYALLEGRAGSVSEIAYAVGFDSLSSFTRAFSARYGHPPSRVAPRLARA